MGRSVVLEKDNRLMQAAFSTACTLRLHMQLLSFVNGKSIVVWFRMLHNELYNR